MTYHGGPLNGQPTRYGTARPGRSPVAYDVANPPGGSTLLPARFHGGDEYGRHTLVVPVHPFGWLVWAYRTCRCPDCASARRQHHLIRIESTEDFEDRYRWE